MNSERWSNEFAYPLSHKSCSCLFPEHNVLIAAKRSAQYLGSLHIRAPLDHAYQGLPPKTITHCRGPWLAGGPWNKLLAVLAYLSEVAQA